VLLNFKARAASGSQGFDGQHRWSRVSLFFIVRPICPYP
jgi:hypothetical protein